MSDQPHDDAPGSGQIVPAGIFAFFSLEGDRFNAPGMPADAAKEVSAYREALVSIAIDLWKRENPDKLRAPRGFAAAFDLRLTEVKAGSAQPQLFLNRPARGVTDEDWDEWEPYYVRARDLATSSVAAVEAADAVPADMEPAVRKALGRVGATLDDDERLRLGAPPEDAPRAVLTPHVRDVLRRIDDVLPPLDRDVAEVGVLTEYDGESLSFILRADSDGGRVKCVLEHFNEPLAQRAREHLAIDGVTAPDVRVEGQTRTREGEAVRHIFNVHSLEVVWTVAEKMVVRRLRELTDLAPGWLGPGSDAPAPELFTMLEPVVTDIATLGLEVSIVPGVDGAVVLSWRAGDVEFTARVGPGRTLLLVSDNVRTDALAERETDFDADLLRRFLREGIMQ